MPNLTTKPGPTKAWISRKVFLRVPEPALSEVEGRRKNKAHRVTGSGKTRFFHLILGGAALQRCDNRAAKEEFLPRLKPSNALPPPAASHTSPHDFAG